MLKRMYDSPFEAQQNQSKRLKMAVVTMLMAVLVVSILSWPRPIFDRQAMAEYIHLPTTARIYEPFCVTIEGLGDPEAPTGLLPESIVLWSTFWSDFNTIGSGWGGGSGEITISKIIPGTAKWCDTRGLDRGQYEMFFILRDERGKIAEYKWNLTVDQDSLSDEDLQRRIDALLLQDVTKSLSWEVKVRTAICFSIETGMTRAEARTTIERWSGLYINDVKVGAREISMYTDYGETSMTVCLNEGLWPGRYIMGFKLKSGMETPISSHEWVLTVTP